MRHQQPRFRLLRLPGHLLHPHDHHVRLLRPNRPPPQVPFHFFGQLLSKSSQSNSTNRSKAQQHQLHQQQQQQQRRVFMNRDMLQLESQQDLQQHQELQMQSRGTQTPVSVARERRKLMWKARISFASDPPARIVRASAPPPKNWYVFPPPFPKSVRIISGFSKTFLCRFFKNIKGSFHSTLISLMLNHIC